MPPSLPPAEFPQKGQVSEWSKELAWKACVGVTLPWVRIPPCPPLKGPNPMRSMGSGLSISAERMRTAVRFEASLRRAEKDGDEVAVNPTPSAARCPPLKGPNPMRSMGSDLSISAERMRTPVRFGASLRRAESDRAKRSHQPFRSGKSALANHSPFRLTRSSHTAPRITDPRTIFWV